MYTDMKTILDDAAAKNYAVVAAAAPTLELARAVITAAHRAKAPLIILLGGVMMARHGNPELLMPVIRKLADSACVPVAVCLDHGKNFEKAVYCLRNGFSSIMLDASSYDMETNIAMTRQIVEMCHPLGMAVEGEIGHVGVAANLDGRDASLYTRPEDAVYFKEQTGVDCLAIACGSAHGKYPAGFVPKLDFDLIRRVKEATGNMPIALHGGSGSGDENILKAVAAGINKLNVATEVLLASRDAANALLQKDPDCDFLHLMQTVEHAAYEKVSHWIALSGSAGHGVEIKPDLDYERLTSSDDIYNSWEE